MKRKKFCFILCVLSLFSSLCVCVQAKKIKSSYKIEKTSEKSSQCHFEGKEIELQNLKMENCQDSTIKTGERTLFSISFVGYDKEPNSNRESFLMVNPTDFCVTGFKVRIDYLDMKGRMLHSREIAEPCFIPDKETRRVDIKTWDTQHTYYYYLGNVPKKVATPFQVRFTPLSYWIISK